MDYNFGEIHALNLLSDNPDYSKRFNTPKDINYSAASDRVSKQPKLLAMYFVLIHCFELILNVSPNDVLIRIANCLNKIALGPKLATPKILFSYLWA